MARRQKSYEVTGRQLRAMKRSARQDVARRQARMRMRAIALAGFVVLAILVLFFVGRCAMGIFASIQEKAATSKDAPVEEEPVVEVFDPTGPLYQNALSASCEVADMVVTAARLAFIETHEGLYPAALIQFAQTYPQTVDFVFRYPKRVDTELPIDLSEEAASGEVPHLLQWDSRWGYTHYGDGVLGRYGCGPTCLSMVAIYLTGNPAYTPVFVAEYAESRGYYTYGVGSDWRLMAEGCAGFGLSSTEVPLGEASMVEQLDAGHPLICAVGPGDFTAVGHYVVLTGYSDGSFTLNDPNSVDNSNRTWTYDELSGQIEGIWAISRA